MTSRISNDRFVWPNQSPQYDIKQIRSAIGDLLTVKEIRDGIEFPRPQYGKKELPLSGVADQLTLTVFQTIKNIDPLIELFELNDVLKMFGGKEDFLEAIQSVDPSLASKISLHQLQRIDLEGVELLDPLLSPMSKIYAMKLDEFENLPDGSKPLYLARMEIEEKKGAPKGEFHHTSLGGIRQMSKEQLHLLPGYAIKALSKQQLIEIDFSRFSQKKLSEILSLKFCPLSDTQRSVAKAKLYGQTEEKKD